MPLIPCDTVLPAYRLPQLDVIIEERRAELKKCRRGQAEKSLWLMFQIAHLEDLREFNMKRNTKCR